MSLSAADDATLQQLRAWLNGIFTHAPISIYLRDPQGRYLWVNRHYERTFGVTTTELRDRPDAHLDAGSSASARAHDRQVLASGEASEREERMGDRTYRVRKCLLTAADGTPVGVLGFDTDITDLKQTQHELENRLGAQRRLEQQLRAFLEAAPDAMMIVKCDGTIHAVNAQTERLFGYRREHLLGQAVERLVPAAVADAHRVLRQRYTAAPSVRPMGAGRELCARARDGRELPVEVSLSPVTAGGESWVAAAVRDVSERRRAESSLRAEKEFSERLLDIAPVIILVLDAEGCIRRFNPYLEAVTGRSAAEVVGQDWFEQFIPADDRMSMRAFFHEVMREGVNRGFVNPLLSKTGARRVIEWYGRTLNAAGGEKLLLNVGYDVTELRASAKALTLAKRRAEQANATKTRFLAAASHDLRQPLQTLELLNGTLRRQAGTEAATLAVLDKQAAAINAMNQMLDSLLNVNQLEQGAIRPQVTDFRVATLLDAVRATFTDLAASRGLRLRVVGSSAVLRSDPGLLGEVVNNLVGNAIKYTRRGKVLVGCRRRGDRLRIEVWDTGPGIPAERREEIFRAFVRLHAGADEPRRGLGLGLSIVDHLTQLLDHPLALRSTPGKGSVFAVTVPSGTAATGSPPAAIVVQPTPAPAAVLYIEDDPNVLDAVRLLLDVEGYRVTAVADADAALREVEHRGCRPALIISDYRLAGGTTGVQAVERLRAALGGAVPALLISGEVGKTAADEAAAQGIELLHKPVDSDRLLTAVSRLARQPAD